METRGTHCSWCEKPETQWNNTFRWWSSRGKRYCSARCFAAAEYQAHIIFAVCSVPLFWFPIMSFAALLLSEMSILNLVASLLLIGIMIAFTGFFVYMVAIGKEERRKRELGNPPTK
jgi:hypothetical protein